jgi:transcriptional regulator with XRE-family HTH domain
MTPSPGEKSFGERVRDGRVAKRISLRELARRVEKAPSYLNDIEYNRRVPSEAVVRQLSEQLDLDVEIMLAAAGRVLGEEDEEYVRSEPTAGVLFRRVAQERLDEEALQELLAQVEQLASKQRTEKEPGGDRT